LSPTINGRLLATTRPAGVGSGFAARRVGGGFEHGYGGWVVTAGAQTVRSAERDLPDQPRPVYLDAASAAPLHPVARQALQAALEDGWADPEKLYGAARRARHLLDAAREATAEAIGCRPEELTFTPGGAEANRRGISGLLRGRRRSGDAIVHSSVEHSSVLHAAQSHVAAGGRAVSVPVDRLGRLDLSAFGAAAAGPGVAAAAVMSANHEVGTVQPLDQVASICASAGVPLLVDAAQSLARVPVPDGWSVLTGSARKWGGPAGVGLLVVRAGVRFDDPVPVPAVPVPLAVAAAASLRAVLASAEAEAARLSPLVERIRSTVAATVPDVEVVGDPVHRLPNLVTFSCLYVDGEALLHALDRRGFAVSSGSSCTSSTLDPSHVLVAMGVLSHGNVRVSLHPGVIESDVDRFLAELPGIVAGLRAEAGVTEL
jgi:cysteine desulfurase